MKIPTKLTLPNTAAPFSRTYWVVTGQLLAGAYPGNLDPAKHNTRLTNLFNSGVRTFINLMEENESNNARVPFVRYDADIRKIAANHGERVAHLRFPIPDTRVTTKDRMRSIIDAIDLSLSAGKPVYIHCFGGMGRTGTAICCWLLQNEFADKQDVLSVLTMLRKADHERSSRPAPENKEQKSFVLDWASY